VKLLNSILNPFRNPSPEEMMVRKLDYARRSLLEAQEARDYANSMVLFHETRIDALRAQIELAMQPEETP
jgi:hypothetical protein